jgi:hypothetical protein
MQFNELRSFLWIFKKIFILLLTNSLACSIIMLVRIINFLTNYEGLGDLAKKQLLAAFFVFMRKKRYINEDT